MTTKELKTVNQHKEMTIMELTNGKKALPTKVQLEYHTCTANICCQCVPFLFGKPLVKKSNPDLDLIGTGSEESTKARLPFAVREMNPRSSLEQNRESGRNRATNPPRV